MNFAANVAWGDIGAPTIAMRMRPVYKGWDLRMLSRATLGRNDLQVTQLGLGCAPLGDLFEGISVTSTDVVYRGSTLRVLPFR